MASRCSRVRRCRSRTVRGARGDAPPIAATGSVAGGLLFASAIASLLGMVLWSFASRWRFPDSLPPALTLGNWAQQIGDLQRPALTTLGVASSKNNLTRPASGTSV